MANKGKNISKNKKTSPKNSKNVQKIAKTHPPQGQKTVHIHNYYDGNFRSKKFKPTKNSDTQTPQRGIGWDGKAKTFRNRLTQVDSASNSTTCETQFKIFEAIKEFDKIFDLFTTFLSEGLEDTERLKVKEQLENIFTGYFVSEKDFLYKLDSCPLSFECVCWTLFVNTARNLLINMQGNNNVELADISKLSSAEITKSFISRYFVEMSD